MKVGVVCERFGRVRDAFLRRGHDAVSCDTEPSRAPGPHITGDALDQDWSGFDLLICHPPCKYLSRAGAWAMKNPGRRRLREQASRFALQLWATDVPGLALENPVGHLWKLLGPPTQSIDPFDFGEPARKRTCLWLRGLPPLVTEAGLWQPCSTSPVAPPPPRFIDRNGKARHFTDAANGESSVRTITFQSIADAMAEQWGSSL